MKINSDILILSPIHNEGARIGNMIDSLTKQTFLNWHLLVYDNSSKDKSRDIVRQKMQSDSRISLEADDRLVNTGENFNRAIHYARERYQSPYIFILGGDDELREDYLLSEFMKAMIKGASVVVPQYELFYIEEGIEIIEEKCFPDNFNFSRIKLKNRINHSLNPEYGNMLYALYRFEEFYKIFDDPRSHLIGDLHARWGMIFSDWWFINTTLRLVEGPISFAGQTTYGKYMKRVSYSSSYHFPESDLGGGNEIQSSNSSRAFEVFKNIFIIPSMMIYTYRNRIKIRNMPEFFFLWFTMVVSRIFRAILRQFSLK
jgi:glycosyltransferase involved in cell wall biosynthesis